MKFAQIKALLSKLERHKNLGDDIPAGSWHFEREQEILSRLKALGWKSPRKGKPA